jgi:hypothetical protein
MPVLLAKGTAEDYVKRVMRIHKREMTRVLLLLVFAIGMGPWIVEQAGAKDAGGVVQFVTPRRFATAVGTATATIQVVPPKRATILSVALFVDGAPVGTTSSPPWMFFWAAGDGTAEHKLDAVARFSDGSQARASVTTSRLIVNESEEVALGNLYAIARGAKGKCREIEVVDNRPPRLAAPGSRMGFAPV